MLTTVHSTLLQGVPINFTLLQGVYACIHEVLQKNMENIISFPKWDLPSYIFKIKHLKRYVDSLYPGIWTNFLIILSILKAKKGQSITFWKSRD